MNACTVSIKESTVQENTTMRDFERELQMIDDKGLRRVNQLVQSMKRGEDIKLNGESEPKTEQSPLVRDADVEDRPGSLKSPPNDPSQHQDLEEDLAK